MSDKPKGQLTLIDLDQQRTGYRQFLSCWLWTGTESDERKLTYVVDPGPASTMDKLISELKNIGINKIDYILITHIHLDHAGGTSQLLDAFPDALVYCHSIGVKHMINPERLWEGSKKVLGEVAIMYGRPKPIKAKSIITKEKLEKTGIKVLLTPGHAVHHVSFLHDKHLYVGELFGTHVFLKSKKLYLRPATPPRFFLSQTLNSLDIINKLEVEPEYTAFAHYGKLKGAFEYANIARDQILQWVKIVKELSAKSDVNLESRLFNRLMNEDPYYGKGRFDEMDVDLQKRERHFLKNTLDGILGYLNNS